MWACWGGVLGGAWSEGDGKGVLGEDRGGCTMRCRGGRTRVPAASGCWSWLLAAGVPTPLATLSGRECMAAGHRRPSTSFVCTAGTDAPPARLPLPGPSPRVCRVGMLMSCFLSTLVCCVLVMALPATDRPLPRIPSWSDRDRNEFVRDLRQIDVAGAAVTDTVPLEVLAAVDRGRNPEAVTKDTLYVRERVLCRFRPPRVAGGRGGEAGMGAGCRVWLALVSAGGAATDGEGAPCARVGARGLGGGRVRTCGMGDPVCERAGGRAMAVWFAAPVWDRGFGEDGAREMRIHSADADAPLLRPALPFSFLGRPLPSPPLPLP